MIVGRFGAIRPEEMRGYEQAAEEIARRARADVSPDWEAEARFAASLLGLKVVCTVSGTVLAYRAGRSSFGLEARTWETLYHALDAEIGRREEGAAG